jgi:hypothetical protein
MKTTFAPPQLPFAPRPFANELFSSWMLRVADANSISLQELMLGFQCRHPDVPCPNSLDWFLPPAFLKAMAWFSRTSIGRLHSLDLRARLPQTEKALLLRFKAVSDRCPRLRKERAGYAFCPTCISHQAHVHVHWEWIFPSLLRCHVHKSPLRHGCPVCGEDDPLPFGTAPAVAAILCRSCGENLTGVIPGFQNRQVGGAHVLVEKVYRAALLGAAPDTALLGEATGAQFRRFVDDLLQLLAWYPSPELSPRFTDPQNLHLSFRAEILAIVGALVMNAAQDSEPNGRKIKSQEGLTLWLRVLSPLSQREEELIETAGELWPPALRRRLASALDHRERSRSRSSQFRSRFFRPGLKYINSFEFRDFSAVNQLEMHNSGL